MCALYANDFECITFSLVGQVSERQRSLSSSMRTLFFHHFQAGEDPTDLINHFITCYPETLILSDELSVPKAYPLKHARNLLGKTVMSVIFDARSGFALDYFLCIAHAVMRGQAILILCSATARLDHDSQRFHHRLLLTPVFNRYFNTGLQQFGQAADAALSRSQSLWAGNKERQSSSVLSDEQKKIVTDFMAQTQGVFTLLSPRGTGKSIVGNYLLEHGIGVIITAPNQNAVIQYDAKCDANTYAPDYLIAHAQDFQAYSALIIEEAAQIPLAHLETLTQIFPKVLIISSIDNYEGTKRGLEMKLPELMRIRRSYVLTHHFRFDQADEVARFCDYLSFSKMPDTADPEDAEDGIMVFDGAVLEFFRNAYYRLREFYQLMNQVHYQTQVQDVRRLMDADQQIFVTSRINQQLVGGIWGIEEGSLDIELAQAVFDGHRRPKGNLVVQTLSAHSYYKTLMLQRSIRISRIAVIAHMRKQGQAHAMIRALIAHATPVYDFISVSFGLTDSLLHFWQQCGFTWIHLGSHRDKVTGLHAAIMIYPLTEQASEWVHKARGKWCADAFYLRHAPFLNSQTKQLLPDGECGGVFDELDRAVLSAYRNHHKNKESVFCALIRESLMNE